MHEKIWPQFSVPKIEFFQQLGKAKGGDKFQAAWLPTSVMLSAVLTIVYLLSNTKRGPKYREMAFKILREIIEQVFALADASAKLDVMHVSIHGAVSWPQCSLRSPRQELWCNKASWSQRFEAAWAWDLNSDKAPWVTTTREKPHLADWIAFCLDQPLKHKQKVLMELQPGVLSMLSQLAFCLDEAALVSLG
ncbi:unnamed protein product [Symbiodinium natans]|uniref:Uncharacterized protein n=1 Tax=Symbiodinium natans TaxID=878477 RepID=A0A812MFL2_9DINO|nr:unnamed protein product [Symbiodinium natans]